MAKNKKKSKDKIIKLEDQPKNSTIDQIEEPQISDESVPELITQEIKDQEDVQTETQQTHPAQKTEEPEIKTDTEELEKDKDTPNSTADIVVQEDNVSETKSAKEVSAEVLEQPTPTPPDAPKSDTASITAPKKRLTLQERLALAAKSGKPKRSTSGNTSGNKSKAQTPEPSVPHQSVNVNTESSIEQTTKNDSNQTELNDNRKLINDSSKPETLFPSNFKEIPLDNLWEIISQAETKFLNIEFKNKSLIEEKSSLQQKVKDLNLSISSSIDISKSNYDQKLKEKDEKISKLLKEGEELSVKELKYSNTIKKLKTKEAENEAELKSLSRQVSSLEFEKREFKGSIKKLQESEQQSILNAKTLKIQLNIEKESLKEEVARNKELLTKIEELNQLIIQEKNSYSKEINLLKRLVEKQNQKFLVSKEEYSREVSRLEEKIEQLRFDTENRQTKTSLNDDSYTKLLRQYDILQNQYTFATENWQSIEASKDAKTDNLESEVVDLKETLKKSESKVEILSKDLSEKVQIIESLQQNLNETSSLKIKLEAKVKNLEEKLNENEEIFEETKLDLKQENSALKLKVQSLEKFQKEAIQAQQFSVPDYSGQFSLNGTSRNASITSIKRNWEGGDISLGESSTTPAQSRKASAFFSPNESFIEEGPHDSYSDHDDNDTINTSGFQLYTGSRHENGSSSVIGGSSVQLMGKLSGQIRRLETELLTLKEQLAKLNEDKKIANEEIVRLMKDNENVENYKNQISKLEEQIENYTKRHEKTLEVLGEKSEQVEELRADVQDWKDLCQLQVQQLVELQTK